MKRPIEGPDQGSKLITTSPGRETAFVRIETVADFHDALLLYLRGVRLSYEPVAGVLGGFAQAMEIVTTRRVADVVAPFKPPKKFWLITLHDSEPETVAGAMAKMLAHKNRLTDLQIDLTALPADDTTRELAAALTGAANLLNWRAARTLSVCDIGDLLEWFAGVHGAYQLDGQIAYGVREWGPFISRSITDHLPQRANPVVSPKTNRTVMCHARPELDDLVNLFTWSHKAKRNIGLINGQTYSTNGTWSCAMSPDKTLRLGNYTIIRPIYGDFASIGADVERAREATRTLARDAYAETIRELDPALSAAWTEQMAFHRLSAIWFGNLDPAICTTDMLNHADKAAYTQADTLKLTRCDRIQQYQPTKPIEFDDPVATATDLHTNWQTFVAANFKPK